MSGKSTRLPRKTDRRVTRSRDALGGALVELMREKPWPEITVQQVLDRAKVGRSTFYAHYRDKNDLFMSDVEDFFETMSSSMFKENGSSRRVLPVREFCAHLIDVREFVTAVHAAGKMQDVWDLGRGYFARAIETRCSALGYADAAQRRPAHPRPYMLAGALISLLAWWMDRGMKETPDEIDCIYHELVWSAVSQLPRALRPPLVGHPGEEKKGI